MKRRHSPGRRASRGGGPWRVSIRYKMLLVVSFVVLFALGSYGYLATSLFTADKLAYIYDLNSVTVAGLTDQARSSLTVLRQVLDLFAREAARSGATPQDRDAAAQSLFDVEPDVVRVELYEAGAAGEPRLLDGHVNRQALEQLELTMQELELLRGERPLPFDAVVRAGADLYVQNSSLPPAAALLTVAHVSPTARRIVVVDLRHDRLLRIFARSRLQESFLVDDRGEVIAHPDPAHVIERRDLSSHPLVREAMRGGVDQGVKEFTAADSSAKLGAFGRVGVGRLWVLTQIPRDEALRASYELVRRTVLFAVAVLLAALVASIFFSRFVTSPIRRLRAATEMVSHGRFDVQVDVHSRDEIGDLARAFVAMAQAVRDAQAQLVQSEKMAAFGQLGAGITHEVKNPMTGILSLAQLAQRRVDDKEKVRELLGLIEQSAVRCRDILVNFLKFARTHSGERELVDINEMVATAATMVRHQLQVHRVRLEVEAGEDVPHVMGSGPELQQVLVNLAINAQQAMTEGGTVRITSARGADGCAVVEVADTGPGVPEALQARIFEPFFTTKPSGEGTGLGLSVSFGIITAHAGTLTVRSAAGHGAVFTVRLPAAPDRAAPQPEGEHAAPEGAAPCQPTRV